MPYFTRRMQSRRFRRMNEWQEETKRLEQLKQEQSNLFKGDKEALDRMRKMDEKSGYRKQEQDHERDSEDRIR